MPAFDDVLELDDAVETSSAVSFSPCTSDCAEGSATSSSRASSMVAIPVAGVWVFVSFSLEPDFNCGSEVDGADVVVAPAAQGDKIPFLDFTSD